jgi:glutathione S-transferase
MEAELPFEAVRVDTKTHQIADGGDYYRINSKGYVPTLEFADGSRLTEGPAIVQWIADQRPEKRLAPPAGTMERYRLVEWLNFTTAELHKQYSPLFNPKMPEEAKAQFRDKLKQRYAWVDGQLAGRSHLLGDDFTVADGYVYVVTRWAKPSGVDLAGLGNLEAFMARVGARPAVQQAQQASDPR